MILYVFGNVHLSHNYPGDVALSMQVCPTAAAHFLSEMCFLIPAAVYIRFFHIMLQPFLNLCAWVLSHY